MTERCKDCDRADCPFIPYDAMDCDAYDAEDCDVTYAARQDCEAHAVDWRAEALRMRPIVDAATVFCRSYDTGAEDVDPLVDAIVAYRATKPRAGEGG